MASEFKIGDIVKVNLENSPSMKIKTVDETTATCVWFDKNQMYHSVIFDLEDLKLKPVGGGIGFSTGK